MSQDHDRQQPALAPLRPSDYLHWGDEAIYNPLTDRSLAVGDAGFAALRALQQGDAPPPADLEVLRSGEWVVSEGTDESGKHLLKYVSLEAHTVCNQKCYFCPVSIDPRRDYFMPTEQYLDILNQLSGYRETIEGVFMINYNEPTLDRRFVDQVRAIKEAGLPPATLTNGSGLTPRRVDALVEMGGLRYLSINLSTLDEARYEKDRGHRHLPQVLANVEYAKDKAVAEEMDIVVLGTGDEDHQRDTEEITERFAGSRFNVKSYEVMDRAGYLEIGLKATLGKSLCGCENIGSRPLQHLHITPRAKCVLCCEDYDEKYEVGDLNQQTVAEVLISPEFRQMRRWAYNVEEAPDDFICRRCVFAQTCEIGSRRTHGEVLTAELAGTTP